MRNIIIIIVLVVILLIILAFWINKGSGKKKRKSKIVLSAFKAPDNIAVNVVKNQIIANWEKIPEAVHYTAYYSNEPFEGKNTQKVLGPIKENKFEMGCIPNGKYYFRVTASKKVGDKIVESELTDLKQVEVNNCDISQAPENLVAKRIDPDEEPTEVLLTWSPSIDADSYEIVVKSANDEEDERRIKIKDPSRSSYKLNLNPETKWTIYIEGENNYCKGKNSSNIVSI
jgi:hypothetical protein